MAQTPGSPVRVRTSRGDSIVAISFIAIGVATIIAVFRFPEQTHGVLDLQSVSFFPLLVALILIGAALRVVLRTSRSSGQEPAAAEAPPRLRRCLLAALMLPLYAAAIFTLGFWVSSSLAVVAMAVLLSAQRFARREWLWLAAVAAIIPGLIIWIFDLFLGVKMPVAGGF